ncbi:MAG: InlB B-repeat-containing protein [Paludibacteraceae bacterium]|nr:InlB B-repeat-containing protein [Paludibacteraceae bacterium]
MKKLFSFISVFALAAILGISTVSAQKTTLSVEKLWSITEPAGGAARQGFGMDGALYYHQQGAGVYKVTAADATPELVISKEATGIGAHAVAKDDAGNIVIFGSTGFPAQTPTGNMVYVQKKGETTGTKLDCPELTGVSNRMEFVAASGNVFSAEGGHIYVMSNDGVSAFDITVKDGSAITATPITGLTLAASQNAVMCVHDGGFHYASAGKGIYSYDGTTATKVEGLTDLNTQCLGATHFTLAGKEIWAYHVGGNYTSEFKIFNKTDNSFITDSEGNTLFVLNDVSKASGGALRGVWLNTEKVDDNTYMLYAWHSHDGGAVYKVSAVVAATITLNVNDAAMGTVEGAGDYAVGGNATIKATPNVGHSFVCWMNGTDTVATTAEYTFKVEKDTAFTAHFQKEDPVKLTLAVNDATKGSINVSDSTIKMGENTVAYGTKVALTAVPAEGVTFTGWTTAEGTYSTEYTIEVAVTADLALTANFTNVLKVAYELNGGVTNAHGWLSKAHMCLDLQKDFNAAAGTSKEWAKEENGVVYYYVKGEWKLPAEVEGSAADVPNFLQAVTYMSETATFFVDLLQTEKWKPLGDYINNLRVAAGNDVANEGALRADLSGFFLNSPAITDYRKTNDYAIAGQPASFCPVMKMGFDNPTEVAFEVTLNDPYRAEFTFAGWYAAADFSGEKVTKVSPESVIAGGKLYAKWVEYIPSIAEVMAMAEGTETKISGVVNWVRNNNVFIQDNTGGFLLYGTDLAPEVGTKIVAKGKRGAFNGSPQLSGTVVESSEPATLFAPANLTLADLVADTTALKYFGQRVQVLGVRVAEYDSYGNIYVTDGTNKLKGHYMTPDSTVFLVGKKVDIVAVASQYKGTVQFEGDVKGITLTVLGKKDTYAYPTRGENNQYKLENRWVISNVEDNFAANAPGGDQKVRGMAAKDGIMYFINHNGTIVRVDGASGDMLEPLTITGDHLFQVQDSTGAWASGVTYGYNDIKFDSEGHCLITGLPTSSAQRFMVYEVDLETGAATEVINERLADNPDFEGVTARFDAMGVNGDIRGNACIMAACAGGGLDVVRWLIEDGVAQPGELISMLFNAETDDYLYESITGWGTAPQIFPQDEIGSLFYVDGNTATPMLIDENGMLIEDLIKCPAGVNVWNNPGDTISLRGDLCGLQEFQIGDEYFFIMIATHTVSDVPQAFALYKFKDEARSFDGLEPLWYFPAKGLGSASNGVRTAVPTVEVNGNKATIYLYAQNNGYAVYEFVNTDLPEGVENVETETIKAQKLIENGQVFIIKNGVKYNVLGVTVK